MIDVQISNEFYIHPGLFLSDIPSVCILYSHMIQSQKSKSHGIYATEINVKIEVKVSHTFLISTLSYHLGQDSMNFIHCSIVLSWIHAVFDYWGSTVLCFLHYVLLTKVISSFFFCSICTVCASSIYGLWLSHWYFHRLLCHEGEGFLCIIQLNTVTTECKGQGELYYSTNR